MFFVAIEKFETQKSTKMNQFVRVVSLVSDTAALVRDNGIWRFGWYLIFWCVGRRVKAHGPMPILNTTGSDPLAGSQIQFMTRAHAGTGRVAFNSVRYSSTLGGQHAMVLNSQFLVWHVRCSFIYSAPKSPVAANVLMKVCSPETDDKMVFFLSSCLLALHSDSTLNKWSIWPMG